MVRVEFFFLLPLISHLATAIADGSPSHGCFWTESCQNKWFGGCDPGLVIADQSDNCNGLCQDSSYESWFPFCTRYYCCKPENPRLMNKCMRCKNKLDLADEYICCSDCSDPYLVDKNSRFGYCKTGAELTVQQKPQEIFKWVAGPWMKCSSSCDGGIRYRDVNCYGSTNDFSTKQYPVDDSRCSGQEMPVRQESCNQQSCGDSSILDSSNNKPSGTSGWLVALLVLLGLVVVGGLGFTGYAYYKRRPSSPSGFVYIMLEGYS